MTERTIKHGNMIITITKGGVANPNHKLVCDFGGNSFTGTNEVDILWSLKKDMLDCIDSIDKIIESVKREG